VLVDSYISAKGKTFLADALEKNLPTEEIINALYERTLSRRPNNRELATINRFMKTVPNRREALEDVFWTLLNSTEFLTKR